ncbi:MAG: hypothetical protein ACFB9N_02630 [Geitlerinemataceae cyanobacterium]
MYLTILSGFLQLLKGVELMGEFFDCLSSPIGLSILLAGLSYQMLLDGGCDPTTAAILGSSIGLTLSAVTQKPQ